MGMRKLRAFIQRSSCPVVRTDNVFTEFVIRKWKTKGELLQLTRKIRQKSSRLGFVIDNTIPSGNIEQESGCTKSPSQKRRLYCEESVSLPRNSGTGVESMARRLRNSNEQTFRRILQNATRFFVICCQCIQHKLEDPEAIATSNNSTDTLNSRQSIEGRCGSRENSTRLEGTDMGITDEGNGNERS
ncbi:MAG: hypothetical protein EZS28_022386 [Streblomastix strix]|uniref:Uncharacterized protein n=1 Tax=Streblomastix strix TaxID=222440 RepID=A0A5J4VIB8_9EUKA|nr:MAG: hypothetical protein EZS28_022386 [Streblomastix strix]